MTPNRHRAQRIEGLAIIAWVLAFAIIGLWTAHALHGAMGEVNHTLINAASVVK